jgi:hypothetical protein
MRVLDLEVLVFSPEIVDWRQKRAVCKSRRKFHVTTLFSRPKRIPPTGSTNVTTPFMTQLSRRAASFAISVTGCSCDLIHGNKHHPYSGGECTIFAFEANGRRIGVRMEQNFSLATRVKVEREIQHLQAIASGRYSLSPFFNWLRFRINATTLIARWR